MKDYSDFKPWAAWCMQHHLKVVVWLVQLLILPVLGICIIGSTLEVWGRHQLRYGRDYYHNHWPHWRQQVREWWENTVDLWHL